jgi:crotonobetainyl-CoA:carnitine CoA-transferase CaiB-like acyl-CoA transferase
VDIAGAQTKLSFAPRYGADTRHVLAEAGYSEGEFEQLHGAGVVA